MTAINIRNLEHWEETPNQRQHIVSDVVTSRAPNEQGRAIIACLVRVFEWEIAHVIQACGECLDWYAQAQVLALWRSHEVCEEELPDR